MMPLLYDEVRAVWSANRTAGDDEAFGIFRAVPVYELSDIVPLFVDWKAESRRKVPRMPPGNDLWCEWKTTDRYPQGTVHSTNGLLLCLSPEADKSPLSDGSEFSVAYAAHAFSQIHSSHDATGNPVRKDSWGQVVSMPRTLRVRLSRDGTSYDIEGHDESLIIPGTMTPQSIGCQMNHKEEIDYVVGTTWPAFMAFALLHCKNIVTEENAPSSLQQKNRKHTGKPRLVTFKTLKIEVPRTVHARQSFDGQDADAGPLVRFHLCSGHFRELRSERYTQKRGQLVWVPAHFRGSKDLGEVHNIRKLVGK